MFESDQVLNFGNLNLVSFTNKDRHIEFSDVLHIFELLMLLGQAQKGVVTKDWNHLCYLLSQTSALLRSNHYYLLLASLNDEIGLEIHCEQKEVTFILCGTNMNLITNYWYIISIVDS